ncbi:hypothetical protein [Pseudothauera lacus]|nr:hypothetical protein [Pseudothauera lacus]
MSHPKTLPARLFGAAFAVRRVALYLAAAALLMNFLIAPSPVTALL